MNAAGDSSIRDWILSLLAARAAGSTICPSEVARGMAEENGGTNWRAMMPLVHAEVDRLVVDRVVRLSWKGVPMASRSGPYRIARADEPS